MGDTKMSAQEVFYNGTLEGFFALLQDVLDSGKLPERVRRCKNGPQDEASGPSLFSEEELGFAGPLTGPDLEQKSNAAISALKTCSPEAYQDCIQAWMSDEPIERDILNYVFTLLRAPNNTIMEQRRTDRSWQPCETVLRASQRYLRELDRLLGLLRFKPTQEGYLVARCEPETFALPGLAEPLQHRFGSSAWAVQDEKRHLVLSCNGKDEPVLAAYDPANPPFSPPEGLVPDEFEALWQEYHEIINIDSRKNPELQKRLMPLRYWKYLPEVQFRRS